MALLFDARIRAIDSSGNPLTGATLTIYDANTTDLTPIFSDVALAVPLVNPVAGASASDAGGWFPQIFAAEGTVVDITLKNSAGTTIQSYVDVTFVGADVGEFERELADATRFKIRGSGSVVYMEFGDPSPDNIGGTAVIGGWAGTQADLITVNAALFNVTGRFKENSKELMGVVYTEATTFTAVASLDIALPNDPSGTIAWDLDIWAMSGLISSNNVVARLSYDNGVTFKSGASDYDTGMFTLSTTYAGASVETDVYMSLSSNATSPANRLGRMTARIITVNSGNDATTVDGRFDAYDNAGTPIPNTWIFNGVGRGNYGRATHIQILGTNVGFSMSGKYRVTALRGFGEA